MSDSTLASLSDIRIKIRRLTRSPSSSQISDSDIDDYINTFILYDMPASIKPGSLKKTLTFYTEPNVDTYTTNTVDVLDPLYNFKNKYTNIVTPIYISGDLASFSQSQEEFYGIYPINEYRVSIGTGNGATTNFTGTLDNTPFMSSRVTISSKDASNNPITAYDNGSGAWSGDISAPGSVSYINGTYDVTLSTAPASGETVYANYVPYTATKPESVLYFNDSIILRPIPDGVYRVDLTVHQRPTSLASDTDLPDLAEWWQYIAYGAAIKILQDRLDMDSVAILAPEFDRQETLIMRRKIIQNSEKRVSTIFTDGYNFRENNRFFGEG